MNSLSGASIIDLLDLDEEDCSLEEIVDEITLLSSMQEHSKDVEDDKSMLELLEKELDEFPPPQAVSDNDVNKTSNLMTFIMFLYLCAHTL